jgi:hypothetical protein
MAMFILSMFRRLIFGSPMQMQDILFGYKNTALVGAVCLSC